MNHTPEWTDSLGWTLPLRLPSAEECTIGPLMARWAQETPNKIFALFEGEHRWTYAKASEEVARAAAALVHLGVKRGDPVLNWLPNGRDQLRLWLATNYIGAIHVPIATSSRGGDLEHIIANSGARLMATTGALAHQLTTAQTAELETVIQFGEATGSCPQLRVVDSEVLNKGRPIPRPAAVESYDIASILYTSGTTGLAKGVLGPYAQFWTLARAHFGYLRADDRMMIATPLSHISTASAVLAALFANGSVAIFERFSTADFWRRVRAVGATALPGLGPAILSFLLKAPPTPEDRDHSLRIVNVRSPTPSVRAFSERFGVDYFASFSMTETSCVTISARNSTMDGSCGRPRPGIEARLVDRNDFEVPVGATGEIALRAALPWTLSVGYHNDPAATARAWRNGWFHTGDLASRDAEGNLFFHDRLKDCIRRRGENISSIEVEREALAHPDVQEAAAVGVPGEFDDQEVLLVVSPRPGHTIDPAALIAFISPRLSYFKIPRYVAVREAVPLTASGKVMKHRLVGDIDLDTCWDQRMKRSNDTARTPTQSVDKNRAEK